MPVMQPRRFFRHRLASPAAPPSPRMAALPWLLAGAFLLGSATTGGAFAAGVIRSADIVDGQVKRADIADDAINGTKVRDGTIRSNDLAPQRWVYVKPAHEFADACRAGRVSTFCGLTDWPNLDWRNYGEGWQPARFREDVTGAVELEGVIRGPGHTAFILPAAYRPQHGRAFAVSCSSSTVQDEHVAGRMSVYPNGRVVWEAPGSCDGFDYISLDGIRFDRE